MLTNSTIGHAAPSDGQPQRRYLLASKNHFVATTTRNQGAKTITSGANSKCHSQGSDFEVRIGDWRLDATVATARALVNGVVLTAALAAKGESSIPATVLSVIVPLVFDLERVAISASDRTVYAALLRDAPDRRAIDGWYNSLPTHLQAEITNLEFRDLIERAQRCVRLFDIVHTAVGRLLPSCRQTSGRWRDGSKTLAS